MRPVDSLLKRLSTRPTRLRKRQSRVRVVAGSRRTSTRFVPKFDLVKMQTNGTQWLSSVVWTSHESNLHKIALPLDDVSSGDCMPEITMPQKLLDVLMLGRCSHEFSWPRRGADGQFYQVCLLCAVEYSYDWTTMRRTQRVDRNSDAAEAEGSATRRSRGRTRKPTWVPRARRLKIDTPVRYRVKNLGSWYEGTLANLSQSGVLLLGPQRFPDNTLVEMVFEMPEEISGQKNSTVLCQGRITRTKEDSPEKPAADKIDMARIAASILDYKFLHQT